jgi:hypothetical protein
MVGADVGLQCPFAQLIRPDGADEFDPVVERMFSSCCQFGLVADEQWLDELAGFGQS